MDTRIRDLLAGRERLAIRRRVASVAASLLLHAALASLFLLGPALAARDSQPIQYTQVQIVPLKALGIADPEPPPRRPEPETPPSPEPETPPSPEPEPAEPRPAPGPDREPVRQPPPPAPAAPSAEGTGGGERPAQRRGAPDGSPLGLAPFGSNESGFDDPNFRYSYYTDMLLAIVGSHYRRPPIAADVEMVVHFRIARDGTIYDAEITRPSGYASFDQAGLSAVRSSKLPHLPVSYPHDSLGVSLIIR